MKNSTAQSSQKSSEKRNPGYAPIRRGLLEYWPAMSVNARAFYVWLHLNAFWQEGPKRGWVEASFEDMARANDWSVKTVQRTIEELEAKPFINVERATNQYELTRVRILKYDLEESISAVDKSDRSNTVGADCGVDSGVDKFDRSTVHSKPTSLQNPEDLHASKKVKKLRIEEGKKLDAVRRPVDAEHRPAYQEEFSPSEKKKKLLARLAAKIRKQGDLYSDYILHCKNRGLEHPFGDEEREAFAATLYKPDLASPVLSVEFVDATTYVYDENRGKGLLPGILCSKIIDYCERERKSNQTLGGEGGYYYPPDFVDHRNRLREKERTSEHVSRTSPEVRT